MDLEPGAKDSSKAGFFGKLFTTDNFVFGQTVVLVITGQMSIILKVQS